jgi:hypothetical protein
MIDNPAEVLRVYIRSRTRPGHQIGVKRPWPRSQSGCQSRSVSAVSKGSARPFRASTE